MIKGKRGRELATTLICRGQKGISVALLAPTGAESIRLHVLYLGTRLLAANVSVEFLLLFLLQVVLDRERRDHFRLRVRVRDSRTGESAEARVSVRVADLNDNRPRVHWPPQQQDGNDTGIRLSTGGQG